MQLRSVAASPGKLLFGKALLCAVSVIKAGHVQARVATSCVESVLQLRTGLFGKLICYFSV